MINSDNICKEMINLKTHAQLMECVEVIKEYDPQPKNKDGSIRWFLYRWDDGKQGVRRLVKCKNCGASYLVQTYHLHKFSPYKDISYEDWYFIESEKEADISNRDYTGVQWELTHTPVIRCEDDELIYR